MQGVRLFRIDGRRVLTKRRFLAIAARTLEFAAWFGANWDAFQDCATDPEWVPAPAYVVLLKNMERFAERAPMDFDTALRILEAAAKFWSEKRGISFHVLVSGAQTAGTPLPGFSALGKL
jgi:RNAse (barnase) inhibitor barstar